VIRGAGRGPAAGQWRWPALAMFAVGYGANHFVLLLAVYRRTLALSDAGADGGRVSAARGSSANATPPSTRCAR
jgi:hypothetical protein